jgi:hypothetical protein
MERVRIVVHVKIKLQCPICLIIHFLRQLRKMDLREMGWGGVDWMQVAQNKEGPVAGSCEHGNEPSGSTKGWGIS